MVVQQTANYLKCIFTEHLMMTQILMLVSPTVQEIYAVTQATKVVHSLYI